MQTGRAKGINVPAEQTFADNLRELRTASGLSQESFASEMEARGYKWHQATVYKAEHGSRQVTVGEARAAADILGVQLDQMTDSPDSELRERLFAVRKSLVNCRHQIRFQTGRWFEAEIESRKVLQQAKSQGFQKTETQYSNGSAPRTSVGGEMYLIELELARPPAATVTEAEAIVRHGEAIRDERGVNVESET